MGHVEDTSPPARPPGPQEVPPVLLRSGRRGLCRAEWRPAAAPDVGGEGREAPLSGTETWRRTMGNPGKIMGKLGKSWENCQGKQGLNPEDSRIQSHNSV